MPGHTSLPLLHTTPKIPPPPLLPSLLSLLIAAALLLPTPLHSQAPATGDEVEIMMPNNPVTEVLAFYEMLTGKRLIRDSNLVGPNLSIMVTGRIPRADAIALIEASLLLNGYSLVPVDATTTTVLGPGRSPLGQGIPLYADPSLLPQGDVLVSYFMLLNYISPQDALAVFNAYVSPRPHGTIVAVPNSNAVVITDSTTLIRRLVALQRFIDVPGARILTEFITLKLADAEKVAETLNKLLEEEKQSDRAAIAPALEGAPQPQQTNPDGTPLLNPAQSSTIQKLTPLIKIVPDPRTNRLLIVAPEHRMGYFRRLVADLDAAAPMEQTLERPLRFVAAGEILPVLESTLAEGTDESSTSGTANRSGQQTQGFTGNTGGVGSTGGTTGGGAADLLSDPRVDTSPIAVKVGKARIIADRSTNTIIVIGPPEVRRKAARIIDLLDQRPKQIYLATIIGQLTLRDNLEAGFDYLVKFQEFSPTSGAAGLLRNRSGTDLLPDPSALLANNVFPALSGLTIYGTIAESVDVFARLLASNNNFRVISRPVVYTANNKRAVISSGEQVPFPASTLTSATTNNSNAVTANISFKDVVLKLEVIPLINSDNEVTLTIAQQNNQIVGSETISGNRVPIIGTQQLTTTITVPDRSTIVLGGLITEENDRGQSGVPLLNQIPGLNYVFGSTTKRSVRRELIILIQPFIIRGGDDLMAAEERFREISKLDNSLDEMGPEIRRAIPVQPPPPGPVQPAR